MGAKKRPEGAVPWMPGFRYGAPLSALSLDFLPQPAPPAPPAAS